MRVGHVALGVRQRRGREAGHAGVLPSAADDGAADAGAFRGAPGGAHVRRDAEKCTLACATEAEPHDVEQCVGKRVVAAALQRKHIGDENLKYRATSNLRERWRGSSVRGGGLTRMQSDTFM